MIFFQSMASCDARMLQKSPLLCISHTNSLSPPHINLYVYKASMINKLTKEREKERGVTIHLFLKMRRNHRSINIACHCLADVILFRVEFRRKKCIKWRERERKIQEVLMCQTHNSPKQRERSNQVINLINGLNAADIIAW